MDLRLYMLEVDYPVYAKTHCTLVHPNSRQQTDHEGNRNDSALLLLGYIAGFDERSLYIYWRAYTPPEYCTSCNVGNHVRLGYTLCIRLSYLSNRAVSRKTTETSILSKAKQNISFFYAAARRFLYNQQSRGGIEKMRFNCHNVKMTKQGENVLQENTCTQQRCSLYGKD